MSHTLTVSKPKRSPPEVLQSSLMDCGPAALKCVLDGFGIDVNYEHIRRRCQTDVDGTSVDAIASLANELGLNARRVLVARDHFLLSACKHLPAIVVVRSDIGELHFVVVWRRFGSYVQVMDPAHGRRWIHKRRLLGQIPTFPIPISAARFRRWAETSSAEGIWRARLARVGIHGSQAGELLEELKADASWGSFGQFDAALRLVDKLVESKSLRRGDDSLAAVRNFMRAEHFRHIPAQWHWVTAQKGSGDMLTSNGYVILQFGKVVAAPARAGCTTTTQHGGERNEQRAKFGEHGFVPRPGLPSSSNKELRPLSTLFKMGVQHNASPFVPCIALAFVASAGLVALEALLLRALIDLGKHLSFNYQQAGWVVALLALSLIGLGLDYGTGSALARVGRKLSTKVRLDILERLPLVGDDYLRTRTTADLAHRAHSVHLLAGVPVLWAQLLRSFASLLVLFCVLVWLYPRGAIPVALMAAAALATPWIGNRALSEGHLKLQTHTASLERFHLDALLGVVPIRVHQAAAALCVEHEDLLTRWGKTAYATHTGQLSVQSLQAVLVNGGAIWLVTSFLEHNPQGAGLLLLTFLALRVPSAAQELISSWSILRQLRSSALRTLTLATAEIPTAEKLTAEKLTAEKLTAEKLTAEKLTAEKLTAEKLTAEKRPVDDLPEAVRSGTKENELEGHAVSLDFRAVDVVCAGRAILHAVTLSIEREQHVAIIGVSGAGKSTLISLVLGWMSPHRGGVHVNGAPLTPESQRLLNSRTVWLDPAVQLWDQSLLDNLTFGTQPDVPLFNALSDASLLDLLPTLPDGLQSDLGEGGVRLSGGQGQRVRLGRSLLKNAPRLVLMDEPFRGLEREKRQALLATCRRHFRRTTLLMVTHDVEDTLEFDKVVIIDQGRIIETGDPRTLRSRPDSRYAQSLAQAHHVYTQRWGDHSWKRLRVESGKLAFGNAQGAT
jgi:ABC-type bacteriocin/lantibiotic exporter with double-glycine peptidase domain